MDHEFSCSLTWTGAAGGPTTHYDAYRREYRVDFAGKPSLSGSAAPPFRGDGSLHNPEDLLMAALSACHCLSYLALAARARIPVVDYRDEAWGRMALVDRGLQFVEVVLRPEVTIASGEPERAHRLHERAHAECFIARSVNFAVRNEPVVRRADTSAPRR
jgi:organic hydroperoxide reductase OsmC/OhrA